MSDVTFDMRNNGMEVHERHAEPWRVTLVDTGDGANTGERLRRVAAYLPPDEPFCFTYGDGLADVDIGAEIAFHRRHGRLVTLCAVTPLGRYGALRCAGDRVDSFTEKPAGDGGKVNGGFFVVSPQALGHIGDGNRSWEVEILPALASRGEVMAFAHSGFWEAMDTLRDKNHLEALWQAGSPPWKVW
jgi:glucose-1-phosphate cytidylyltransferase